jgi:hypothetical protein
MPKTAFNFYKLLQFEQMIVHSILFFAPWLAFNRRQINSVSIFREMNFLSCAEQDHFCVSAWLISK